MPSAGKCGDESPNGGLYLLSILMLLHRIFWPLVHRPIYALQRFGIFQHRKTIASIGSTIALASLKSLGLTGPLADLLDTITKKLFD